MAEKVYTYVGVGTLLPLSIGMIGLSIIWWLIFGTSLILGALGYVCALLAVLLFLNIFFPFIPHYSPRKIVINERGVILDRGPRSPIVIRKITSLKAKEKKGRVVSLTVEGLTPDGRRVKKKFIKNGDLSKRMEEFNNDLKRYVTPM